MPGNKTSTKSKVSGQLRLFVSLAESTRWINADASWVGVGLPSTSVAQVAGHVLCALGAGSAVPALAGLPRSITLYVDPAAACPLVHGGANESSSVAKIRLTIPGAKWCQAVFQFGHELGHVLSNSWGPKWQPESPHVWLEEACCGAISLLALERMSRRWAMERILNDGLYAGEFTLYLQNEIASFRQTMKVDVESLPTWFTENAELLSGLRYLADDIKPFSALLYESFLADPKMWHDMRALNRWAQPRSLSLSEHLSLWKRECAKLGTPGRLPEWCRNVFLIAGT